MATVARNWGPWSLSIVAHAVLLALFSLNLVFLPQPKPAPLQLAIEATVVETSQLKPDPLVEQRRQIERQRVLDEQRRAEEEARQLEQARQAEQRAAAEAERLREEQERQREAEAERQRVEAEKRAEAERRQREEAERLAAQKRAEEEAQRRREAEQRQREAAERARQEEMEQQLAAELAAEEQRREAVNSGLLAQYIALITNRIERNWVKPPSARPGLDCDVSVRQIPGGEVIDVRIGSCNGDAAVIRSIESAVYRASPLPTPGDPSLFERNLRIRFRPEE